MATRLTGSSTPPRISLQVRYHWPDSTSVDADAAVDCRRCRRTARSFVWRIYPDYLVCTNWSGWFREDNACCLQTPLRLAKRFEAKSLTLGRPDRIEYGKIYLEESMTITIKKLHLAIAVVAIAMIAPAAALATHSFTDVPDGAFYTDPVEWAAANGITLGQTPTEFAPLAPVTRGQSVTFLKRYDDNIVQPELAALQADFAAMQSDLEALMDDVGTLQTDVVVIQSDVGTLQSDVLLIQSDVGTLETLLASVSLETVDGQPTLRFTGVNVQVVDGSGNTAGAINGLGNLIVGYNENSSATRTGSHNLVVGMNNSYTSYGGFVGGENNTLNGSYATVAGGVGNTASTQHSAVLGGFENISNGTASAILGGRANTAPGEHAAVLGGQTNSATGLLATVSGGFNNTASGDFSSVLGGIGNNASGEDETIIGGDQVTCIDDPVPLFQRIVCGEGIIAAPDGP